MVIHNNTLPGGREKCFGIGRPQPIDRNAKARIMVLARALSRRTEPGRHWGVVTAKALDVLYALLWTFHNARTGHCFPGYEAIAAAAGCARSTVAVAIKALEDCGILSWCHRIVRVRETARDLFGHHTVGWRVERTSNSYWFNDPKAAGRPQPIANASKSELPTGTGLQVSRKKESQPVKGGAGWFGLPRNSPEARAEALDRLRAEFGDLIDRIPDA